MTDSIFIFLAAYIRSPLSTSTPSIGIFGIDDVFYVLELSRCSK